MASLFCHPSPHQNYHLKHSNILQNVRMFLIENLSGSPTISGRCVALSRLIALEVALESLAGILLALDPSLLHLDYRLLVAIEAETGLATKSHATTTVDVVGQILDRGPTPITLFAQSKLSN